MANEYADIDRLKARLRGKVRPEDDSELTDILEATSRLIDNALLVPGGYFTPQTTQTTKRVYGTGSTFITLPMAVRGTVTIAAPSGYTVPNFTIDGLRLITLTDDGFRNPFLVWAKIYYDITGIWGYAAVPAEVREACLQISVRFWRGRDEAFSGVIGNINKDGNIIEKDLPAPVRRILDDLRRVLAPKRNGGLVLA